MLVARMPGIGSLRILDPQTNTENQIYVQEYKLFTKFFYELNTAFKELEADNSPQAVEKVMLAFSNALTCTETCVNQFSEQTRKLNQSLVDSWRVDKASSAEDEDKLLDDIKQNLDFGDHIQKYVRHLQSIADKAKGLIKSEEEQAKISDMINKTPAYSSQVNKIIPYAQKIQFNVQVSKYYARSRYLTMENAVIPKELVHEFCRNTWYLWNNIVCGHLVDADIAALFCVSAEKNLNIILQGHLLDEAISHSYAILLGRIKSFIDSYNTHNKEFFVGLSPYIYAAIKDMEVMKFNEKEGEAGKRKIIAMYEAYRGTLDYANNPGLYEFFYPQEVCSLEYSVKDLISSKNFDFFNKFSRKQLVDKVDEVLNAYRESAATLLEKDGYGNSVLMQPFSYASTRFLVCTGGGVEFSVQMYMWASAHFEVKCKEILSRKASKGEKAKKIRERYNDAIEFLRMMTKKIEELVAIENNARSIVLQYNPLAIWSLRNETREFLEAAVTQAANELKADLNMFEDGHITKPVPQAVAERMVENITRKNREEFAKCELEVQSKFIQHMSEVGEKVVIPGPGSKGFTKEELESEENNNRNYKGGRKGRKHQQKPSKQSKRSTLYDSDDDEQQATSYLSPEEIKFQEAQSLRVDRNRSSYENKLIEVIKLSKQSSNRYINLCALQAKIENSFLEIDKRRPILVTYEQLQDHDFREKNGVAIGKGFRALNEIEYYSAVIRKDLQAMKESFIAYESTNQLKEEKELEIILENIEEYQYKSQNLQQFLKNEKQTQTEGQEKFFQEHPELRKTKKRGEAKSPFAMRMEMLDDCISTVNDLAISINTMRGQYSEHTSAVQEPFVNTQNLVSTAVPAEDTCSHVKKFLEDVFSKGSSLNNVMVVTSLYNLSRAGSQHTIKMDSPAKAVLESHKICNKDGLVSKEIVKYLEQHLSREDKDGAVYKFADKELRAR